MLASDGRRFVYEKTQLAEVLCQLRFPTILSVESNAPVEFQDTIRAVFPRYSCVTEPIADGTGEKRSQKNHTFITADGSYKLNLTQSFIALSTMRYTGWEDFAGRLDEPLGQFIRIYRPAFFERIGLRYINAISRQKLELEGYRWNDLLQPFCLGPLDLDEVEEESVESCSVDVKRRLDAQIELRMHAGPGKLQRAVRNGPRIQTVQEPETRFILDLDLYALGELQLQSTMELLARLHDQADKSFSEAITDTLHEAMEPVYV